MSSQLVLINGKQYNRQAEVIAGEGENRVEKITFYLVDSDHGYEQEIYDQDLAYKLEMEFEKMCAISINPKLFFI